ncbi:MAG: hypothetical protein FWD68_01255 [Alphaproteobacteria bacterium]|nr:hypothetical protein [Alphaproteobacteria bacterium]
MNRVNGNANEAQSSGFEYLDQLNRFEVAQETIGFMMAMRSAAIHEEQEKAQPDSARIAQWRAEFQQFASEQDDLRLDDDAAIQRVFDEYCPIVKADYERRRAAT